MTNRINSIFKNRDVLSALVFFALGMTFAVSSFSMAFGEPMDMGPAFFPRIVSMLLIGISVIIAIQGFLKTAPDPQKIKIAVVPILIATGGVVAFSLALRPLGLIAASALLVLISGAAMRDARWRELVISAVVLSICCGVLFIYVLGLQARLLPWD
jgi:hypothetical protein